MLYLEDDRRKEGRKKERIPPPPPRSCFSMQGMQFALDNGLSALLTGIMKKKKKKNLTQNC